jgi:environmental stress-induced protein Ves
MRVLRRADFRTMPWKNGGGETTEILVSPNGATMDNFDWRVSMARVGSDGPFSLFPGIERSLTLLEGVGMTLHIERRGAFHLTPVSRPLNFPGDVTTVGELTEGPILDLNVMTRRGVCRADVEQVTDERYTLSQRGLAALFLVRGGTAHGEGIALDDGDAVVLDAGDAPLLLSLSLQARGYAIHIL